jgi:hypothetical protein
MGILENLNILSLYCTTIGMEVNNENFLLFPFMIDGDLQDLLPTMIPFAQGNLDPGIKYLGFTIKHNH